MHFKDLFVLRSQLVESLIQSISGDGLYRSQSSISGIPSFTSTGIVVQALHDAGKVQLAQKIVNSSLEYLKTNNLTVFPNENGSAPHLMCNSWMLSSILNCLPHKCLELVESINWILDNQNSDGSWDLYPGYSSRKPIWTAYTINCISEAYFAIVNDKNEKLLPFKKKLIQSIKSGCEFLVRNRSANIVGSSLYLWNVSISEENSNLSFCTSSMCMYSLTKASKILNSPIYQIEVEKTLLKVIEGYDSSRPNVIKLNEFEIRIWDFIEDHSFNTYYWGFFAPIELVHLVRYSKNEKFMTNPKYHEFFNYLCGKIIQLKAYSSDGLIGIKGNENIDSVKTWSTGLAVISISRILYKLPYYYFKMEQELSTVTEKNKYLEERFELLEKEVLKLKNNHIDESFNKSKKRVVGFALIVLAFISIPFGYFVINNWDTIESIIFILSFFLAILGVVLGINFSRFLNNHWNNCVNYFALRRPKEKIFQDIDKIIKNL